MMWGQVRSWRASGLDEVARGIGGVSEAMRRFEDQARATPQGWVGAAADAAGARRGAVTSSLALFVAQVDRARRAVLVAADAVAGIEAGVRDVQGYATAFHLVITDDGRVTSAATDQCFATQEAADLDAKERLDQVNECVRRMSAVLDRAAQIDHDLAAALVASRLGQAQSEAADAAIMHLCAPTGKSPQATALWWKSLTPSDKAWILAHHPEWVNNADGVDAATRDNANRALLPRYRAQLQAELDALTVQQQGPARLTPRDAQNHPAPAASRLQELKDKLASLDAVETLLSTNANRRLLSLDISHARAQAVVAVGDVDTATHVAVFTPGFTSTVNDSLATYDHDMRNLLRQTQKVLDQVQTRGQSVAMVTWLGYQAPQWGTVLTSNSVASAGPAKQGADALTAFTQGLESSRTQRPDVTLLGHSYGSTTTGYAALEGTTGADRVVLFGSPGIGTDHQVDLGMPSYLLEAKDDPVAHLGVFGLDPSWFMSNQLQTGPTPGRVGSTGHSEYLLDNSTSQYNMATLVANRPDLTIHGHEPSASDLNKHVPVNGRVYLGR